MPPSSPPSPRNAHLAVIGFSICHKHTKRFGRHRGMHFHDERKTHDAGDWRDIAREIEVELVVEGHADHIRWPCQEKRVTICGRSHDCLTTRARCEICLFLPPLKSAVSFRFAGGIEP